MAEKIQLTKKDRLAVAWRSTFIQGSWNYERMQNGGWAFSMIPAIKKLYKTKEERSAALKRHLEFFNTHPYIASPILGVTLALEEERANGAPVDDVAIQGVKVGMMGPLAGVGDPVFWFTVRPMLGALGASLAMGGNILGPILFFVAWNLIRWSFMWYTQEFGYKAGSKITDDLSGGLLQDITKGASILGMFVLAALVQRWVSIKFLPINHIEVLQRDAEKTIYRMNCGDGDGIMVCYPVFDGVELYYNDFQAFRCSEPGNRPGSNDLRQAARARHRVHRTRHAGHPHPGGTPVHLIDSPHLGLPGKGFREFKIKR